MVSVEAAKKRRDRLAADSHRPNFGLLALDRDGTVIQHAPYLHDPDQVQLLPTVAQTIAKVNAFGIPVIVITNQSGVARGMFGTEDIARVNARMSELLTSSGAHLDAIYVCEHGPEDRCACRKPQPGLIIRAAHDFRKDLEEILVVGDNISDGYAAEAAGARFVGVLTGIRHESDAAGRQWKWMETLGQAVFLTDSGGGS